MLTLTRKAGESIRIGDEISIIIKEIKGRQVRIGIVAPRNIYVCREELYLKIQEENRAAHESLKDMTAISEAGVISDPVAAIGTLFRQRMGYGRTSEEDVCSDISPKIKAALPSTSGEERSKLTTDHGGVDASHPSSNREEAGDEG